MTPVAPVGIDRAAPVRAGEELDEVALRELLARHGLLRDGALVVEQFPRGFSNLTYLVRSGDAEYVLRRPPFGVGRGSAHDMVREARILAALGSVYDKVPRVLAVSEDATLLGAPCYLMERARGVILRDRVPDGLSLNTKGLRRLSTAAVDTLAEIHAVDHHGAGLASLGNPAGYVERQIGGWTSRYEAARTGAQPDVERLAAWLAEHRPPERGAALIHNDFKHDNLVLAADDPTRVTAVLDWEMATVGDPLMDLGTTLAYWIDADDPPAIRALGIGITALPGNLTRSEVTARYATVAGRDVSDVVFYYAYGLFKVAVIAQQIYARYAKGLTTDPRFAALDRVVAALGWAGTRAVELGRIDRLG
jgi:aminoglycoside phosphotransferase (APT) family kinase protein